MPVDLAAVVRRSLEHRVAGRDTEAVLQPLAEPGVFAPGRRGDLVAVPREPGHGDSEQGVALGFVGGWEPRRKPRRGSLECLRDELAVCHSARTEQTCQSGPVRVEVCVLPVGMMARRRDRAGSCPRTLRDERPASASSSAASSAAAASTRARRPGPRASAATGSRSIQGSSRSCRSWSSVLDGAVVTGCPAVDRQPCA